MLSPRLQPLIEMQGVAGYSQLNLFSNVDLSAISALLEICPVQALSPGEILLKPDRINRTLYAVLSGTLTVHAQSPDEPPVRTLRSGDTVMELSVVDGRATTAWIVARTQVRLLSIDHEVFWAMVRSSHGFSRNILQSLAFGLRRGRRALEAGAPPAPIALVG